MRIWVVGFIGFFLVNAAWALAAPYDGVMDEMEHVFRAAAVVRGELMPPLSSDDYGTGAVVMVPASLVRVNCWAGRAGARPATCASEPGGDRRLVSTVSRTGRYHPAYYALVGWPLRWWPNWPGVMLARLLSAALVAAFLAAALACAAQWSRHRLMVAGVLVAVTPMTPHLAGSVNPNGLEVAAGVALFAALVPLLVRPAAGTAPEAADAKVLPVAGLAAVTLLTVRPGGPLWFAIALAVLLVPTSRARLAALWSRAATRTWVMAIAVAGAGALAWTTLMRANQLGAPTVERYSFIDALKIEIIGRWWGYYEQAIGYGAWNDARLPSPVYLIWSAAISGLVLSALVLGGWTDRWRLAALALGGMLVPTTILAANSDVYGPIGMGRYFLPVLVGVPILAAYVLAACGVTARHARSAVRMAVLLLPLHLVALVATMVRWQAGVGPVPRINPLRGSWHPPLGSALPLLTAAAGLVVLGVLAWRLAPRADGQAGAPAHVPAADAAEDPDATENPATIQTTGCLGDVLSGSTRRDEE